jgi:hypothetical protein
MSQKLKRTTLSGSTKRTKIQPVADALISSGTAPVADAPVGQAETPIAPRVHNPSVVQFATDFGMHPVTFLTLECPHDFSTDLLDKIKRNLSSPEEKCLDAPDVYTRCLRELMSFLLKDRTADWISAYVIACDLFS